MVFRKGDLKLFPEALAELQGHTVFSKLLFLAFEFYLNYPPLSQFVCEEL